VRRRNITIARVAATAFGLGILIAIEGQMLGGAVQSLGIALSEGFMYDDRGRLRSASLFD